MSNSVKYLSPGAQTPVAVGTLRPTVCVAVSDCISLPTHVCLGLEGHLAPFLGWLVGPEATQGQDRQDQR